ncbi:MAG: UDP-N-acetylmuramate dehydrogenase [Chloroflexi bacterium]|nr:UDP-N-acetylmuramate dehydrogenase [Chloroflexota bacterium]
MDSLTLSTLRTLFGERIQENVPLSGYTSARIGGPADVLLVVRSAEELAQAAQKLWETGIPFLLFGGGSNVLVSDKGVRGVTLLNRARLVKFDSQAEIPSVYAESGATLNDIAQRAARLSLSGLEWAASVPGSLGGAVYGNAGAFGGDMAGNVISVDILHPQHGRQSWPVEKMEYGYRSSVLKAAKQPALILSATLKLSRGNIEAIQAKMAANSEHRRGTQPPGASMGSMFKNPPDDKAGRLLEAAGLKGTRIGNAEISRVHANFFINTDKTRAEDMKALLDLAQKSVFEKFGVKLEPEIEIVGEW